MFSFFFSRQFYIFNIENINKHFEFGVSVWIISCSLKKSTIMAMAFVVGIVS